MAAKWTLPSDWWGGRWRKAYPLDSFAIWGWFEGGRIIFRRSLSFGDLKLIAARVVGASVKGVDGQCSRPLAILGMPPASLPPLSLFRCSQRFPSLECDAATCLARS